MLYEALNLTLSVNQTSGNHDYQSPRPIDSSYSPQSYARLRSWIKMLGPIRLTRSRFAEIAQSNQCPNGVNATVRTTESTPYAVSNSTRLCESAHLGYTGMVGGGGVGGRHARSHRTRINIIGTDPIMSSEGCITADADELSCHETAPHSHQRTTRRTSQFSMQQISPSAPEQRVSAIRSSHSFKATLGWLT